MQKNNSGKIVGVLLTFIVFAVIVLVVSSPRVRKAAMQQLFHEESVSTNAKFVCPLCGASFTFEQLMKKAEAERVPVVTVKPEEVPTLKSGMINDVLVTSIKPYLDKSTQEGKALIVKFYGPWCPICKSMKPHDEALAKEFGDKLYMVHIDIDQPVGKEVAHELGVFGVPTYLFFVNGVEEKGMRKQGVAFARDVYRDYITKLVAKLAK